MSKRPRTRGGASSSTHVTSDLHPFNRFTSPAHQQRYDVLSTLPIEPNRFIVMDDLIAVGIGDEVQRYISRFDWDDFVGIRENTIKELFLEFLATFSFNRHFHHYDEDDVVQFRLGGINHSLSISQFGVSCGFYTETFLEDDKYKTSVLQFPDNHLFPGQFWYQISLPGHQNYDPTKSKSTGIRSPTLRYLHRLIVHTITGRRESTGVVTQRDLFYLWCLVEGRHCNLGCCLAYYFGSMVAKRKGALCGGTYVTALARKLGVFRHGLTIAVRMLPLGLDMMRNMGMIRRQGLQYILVDQDEGRQEEGQGDIPLHEPEPIPTEPPADIPVYPPQPIFPPSADFSGTSRQSWEDRMESQMLHMQQTLDMHSR